MTACGAIICLGLLTFVLDLANSRRMVWGRSGSNLTPCCKKKQGVRHGGVPNNRFLSRGERRFTGCTWSAPRCLGTRVHQAVQETVQSRANFQTKYQKNKEILETIMLHVDDRVVQLQSSDIF